MLGKLMGRRRGEDRPKSKSPRDDKAIIHQTVPDEVFATRSDQLPPQDQSWLDDVPVSGNDKPKAKMADPAPSPTAEPARTPSAAPAPSAAPKASAPAAPVAVSPAATAKAPSLSGQPANSPSEGRPRFPYGWLVVVEGPGTGEWFPLEKGTARIGGGADQTVQLDFGDASIKANAHASLAYDDARHGFLVEPGAGAQLRINGVTRSGTHDLRDGDVITLGGTSLRLVALCSQNFHWGSDLEARR